MFSSAPLYLCNRLVPSRYLCVLGVREECEKSDEGEMVFSLCPFPWDPRVPQPNPHSSLTPKHTNSDWVGVCLWKWKEMKLYYVLAFTALLEFLLEIIILHLNKPQTGLQYSRPLTNMSL